MAETKITQNERLADVAIGTISSGTSTGNLTVSGLSFSPRVVNFTVVYADGVASNYNASITKGAMDYHGNQWAVNSVARNGNGGSTYTSTSQCIKLNTIAAGGGSAGANLHCSYVSMNPDGFTISVDTYGGGGPFTICYEAQG